MSRLPPRDQQPCAVSDGRSRGSREGQDACSGPLVKAVGGSDGALAHLHCRGTGVRPAPEGLRFSPRTAALTAELGASGRFPAKGGSFLWVMGRRPPCVAEVGRWPLGALRTWSPVCALPCRGRGLAVPREERALLASHTLSVLLHLLILKKQSKT